MPIFLTPNNDTVSYATSNSPLEIYGLAGNDDISGGNDSDFIDGGDGNDTIRDVGGFGNDHFVGGAGDDNLFAIAGDDWLEGGTGNDVLVGGAGNDTLDAGSGTDNLDGGDGNDLLIADGSFADGPDLLFGGDGNDVYSLSGLNFKITDTSGLDRIEISVSFSLASVSGIEDLTLTGTSAINGTGNAAANTINGNDAANLLDGGDGNDLIRGFGGNDTLIGGPGGGVEYLYGGTGDDTYVVLDAQDTPVEYAGEGHDVVQSSVRWVLGDNFEDLVLTGGANINGFGNGLANQLTGNSGNNYLQGYGDFDVLNGGAGNDFYELGDLVYRGFFGYTFDSVTEGFNAGNDTVRVTATADPRYPFSTNHYSLGANIEVGIIAGTIAFNLNGNELANTLTGNGAANELDGFGGNDRLDGGDGADTLTGDAGDDVYVLNDTFAAGAFSITKYDTVIEAADGGNDTVLVNSDAPNSAFSPGYTLGANVENGVITGSSHFFLRGNDLKNDLIGNSAANLLQGFGDNDWLDGGAGADTLDGGSGNDTYVLNDTYVVAGSNTWDTIIEGADGGIDTVYASADVGRYTYQLEANVENLVATGVSVFRLWGNELNNSLTGNAADNVLEGFDGDDRLEGGGGADTLIGDGGDDTYVLNDTYLLAGSNTWDTVIEAADGGSDTVYASADVGRYTYQLEANVENLVATGISIFRLWGNELDNGLTGNAAANVLDGFLGSDLLDGRGGDDSLIGDAGNDTLKGGNGADTLLGGSGSDLLNGGGGKDKLVGGGGSDLLNGGGGSDLLNGGGGNDNLVGGGGNDKLVGGRGIDILIGGGGNDNLVGSGGNDSLVGGGGNDSLVGGGGNDTFVFANRFGVDTIADFAAGNAERIDLSAVTAITDFADLVAHHLVEDPTTHFAKIVVAANSILLDGITVSEIGDGLAYSANDFTF